MSLHDAPPVVYPLGRSRFLGAVLMGLWLSGLVLAVLWYFKGNRQLDWRLGLAAVSAMGAGVYAYIGWRNSPAGQLVWDGDVWHCESPGYHTGAGEYELSVLGDFQRGLLLRLESPAHAWLWLWVERGAMPERWLELRRAVYSPRKLTSTPSLHDSLPSESGPAVAVSGSMRPTEVTSQHS